MGLWICVFVLCMIVCRVLNYYVVVDILWFVGEYCSVWVIVLCDCVDDDDGHARTAD